jgi:hypothetical protein
MTQCNDSDTRSIKCPHCLKWFDGELPEWEAGEEECPNCDGLMNVAAYETKPSKP